MTTDVSHLPVPAGLTVTDKDGQVYPIVALQVQGTTVTPMLLEADGSIGLASSGLVAGMSKAWLPEAD